MPITNNGQKNDIMMRRFITYLVILLSSGIALQCVAQEKNTDKEKIRKEKWEQFRKMKHDFFVQKLQLTDEQADKFFPLYDEMEQKRFELGRDIRRECRRINKEESAITEAEYQAVAEQLAALRVKEVTLEQEYYSKFCTILNPKQQYIYHSCEPDFHKQIIQKKSDEKRHNNKKDKHPKK